jgi:hypothetical protein
MRVTIVLLDFRYIPKKQSYDGEEYYDDDGQERLEELQKKMQDLRKTITKTKVLVQLHFEIQTTKLSTRYPSDGQGLDWVLVPLSTTTTTNYSTPLHL